jgi:hypothetical protein
LTIFGFNAPIYANLFDDEVAKELSVARGGRKDCLRRTPLHPARLQWAGSDKTVNRAHAVPPMNTAPRQAKTSRQASEGTPI